MISTNRIESVNYEIQTESLKPGLYFIQISTNKGIVTCKCIKE
ncbi:MAG: T9SS type A sorting domain-containing protein [Saprospiraceae bacterium]|nr:T9SS type A sorting domain-containing protein [Saprospiraceae bacterium]